MSHTFMTHECSIFEVGKATPFAMSSKLTHTQGPRPSVLPNKYHDSNGGLMLVWLLYMNAPVVTFKMGNVSLCVGGMATGGKVGSVMLGK